MSISEEESGGSNREFWVCPKSSCGHLEILINRNERNIIRSTTYRLVIIHFLKHLKRDIIYFGPSDIHHIFLNYAPDNIFSPEELERESNSDLIWKNYIRTSLATINRRGYLETDETQPLIRQRKRTEMFLEEFEKKDELYDDWDVNLEEQLIPIEYALKGERANIFALTVGFKSQTYTHQIFFLKKNIRQMGPFLLFPKKSKSIYIYSDFGAEYDKEISGKKYSLQFIAYVDALIKVKITPELFQSLFNQNFYPLWHPEEPMKYFDNNSEGYLVIFRVYEISSMLDDIILEEQGFGRSSYFKLNNAIEIRIKKPVLSVNDFYEIKSKVIQLLEDNKWLLEMTDDSGVSVSSKPKPILITPSIGDKILNFLKSQMRIY